MKDSVQKNILDLHFQKHLVVASTSVVVAFTYIVGAAIAMLARQIPISGAYLTIFFLLSGMIIGPCAVLLYNAVKQMQVTLYRIQTLK